MIKIIHFSVANQKGGITQYVLNNWKHIDKTKFQFDIVTFGDKLDFQEELEEGGCKVFYVKYRAEDNLKAFRNNILKIFSNKYDVVHIHTGYWKSFEIELLARAVGIPKIIVHAHNTDVFDDVQREEKRKNHMDLKEQLTPDIATDYWACSRVAAEWLFGDKIPKKCIKIMENAIDIEHFSYNMESRIKYRQKHGWTNNLVIGHVGRFSYQKNHEFLIKVFSKVVKENKEARLILIGKGILENQIFSLVEKYGISNKVLFAGPRDDVNCWMQAMDVFCLTSRFEGLPIVAIEAQAAGLECVLSSNITKETAVTNLVTFVPEIIDDWVKTINSVQYKKKDRSKFAEQMISSSYDIKNQVKKLEQAYLE